jgi:hypothetical protein
LAVLYSKWPLNTFSNSRPSKIYQNWEFWFENTPSGNPALELNSSIHIFRKNRDPRCRLFSKGLKMQNMLPFQLQLYLQMYCMYMHSCTAVNGVTREVLGEAREFAQINSTNE